MMQAMNRRAFLALSLGSSIAALTGCRSARASAATQIRQPASTGRSVQEIAVGGVTRRYVRYEPPGLDPSTAVPLVLVLHGRGGNGTIAERLYEMNDQASPTASSSPTPTRWATRRPGTPASGWAARQADDVDFIRALVEREASTRALDPNRIFTCGHSSGALMSYRLAAEASDLFPAVGIVAGSVGVRGPGGRTITIPKPPRPVSVIHFHGTDDPLVPYNGGGPNRSAGFVVRGGVDPVLGGRERLHPDARHRDGGRRPARDLRRRSRRHRGDALDDRGRRPRLAEGRRQIQRRGVAVRHLGDGADLGVLRGASTRHDRPYALTAVTAPESPRIILTNQRSLLSITSRR